MAIEQLRVVPVAENYRLVRSLLSAQVMRGELELPVLPEVAARVVSVSASAEADAPSLARIITGDQALAAHVMRVATSAAYQPRSPIESLQHAISWLGMAEVSDIAFTVAVQGKLMNVPGQKNKVMRMWKSAVATGLWASAVAEHTRHAGEACYLSGLLHEIGKPVCLQAASEIARRSASPLIESELDSLIAEFHVEVGSQLAVAWKLPVSVATTIRWWREWANAPERKDECAIVYLAHHLAGHMLEGTGSLAAGALAQDPVAEHLGLSLAEVLALCAQADHVQALVDNF
ncbi:MAG: HDOD domain-containing protein [Steroidobacteraceae bacterium]|nr:HDOD domain-containing protein [Steroidobacteraceae bacterium]